MESGKYSEQKPEDRSPLEMPNYYTASSIHPTDVSWRPIVREVHFFIDQFTSAIDNPQLNPSDRNRILDGLIDYLMSPDEQPDQNNQYNR